MSFLVNVSKSELAQGRAYKAYMEYLNSIKDRLPSSAYEFAAADWHYDYSKRKCPHDAWVQEIRIRELAEGERHEIRKVQIEILLLGAYHDRLLKVTYADVFSHSLSSLRSQEGYGDWLLDEISLSDSGLVLHEIRFANDSLITIECRDIIFQEQLTDIPYSAVWI